MPLFAGTNGNNGATTREGPFEHDAIRRSANSPAVGSKPTASSPASAGALPRVLLGLLAVIVLFFAIVALGNKIAPGAIRSQTSAAVKVVAKSVISPRQQLMLVQVGRRLILVGNGGGEMNSLCQIDDPAEVAELLAQIKEEKSSSPRSFGAIFGKASKKREAAGREMSQNSPAPPAEDLTGLAERVRTISRQFQKS